MSTFAVGRDFWAGRRVLVTGLTGFKGAWLGIWLEELGCEVLGCSLEPETEASLFDAAEVGSVVDSRICDLRDIDALFATVEAFRPQLIFHLAAQSKVLVAQAEPRVTFETNVMGTVHVLELLRMTPGVEATVIVTTDKCYRNRGWSFPYRENDELGGDETYAASKSWAPPMACTSAPRDDPAGQACHGHRTCRERPRWWRFRLEQALAGCGARVQSR